VLRTLNNTAERRRGCARRSLTKLLKLSADCSAAFTLDAAFVGSSAQNFGAMNASWLGAADGRGPLHHRGRPRPNRERRLSVFGAV